jgi:S-(hydroxymethyl)glutathione dehydrogenase/alcohol dehydrogenase
VTIGRTAGIPVLSPNPTKSKPGEAVRDLLPGGADHVFDFVGLKLVAEQGLAMLGAGGGLYLVGVSKPEVDLSLNIFDAIGGQKRVLGVNFGSTNAKRDIPVYAELYLQGRMNLEIWSRKGSRCAK